MTTLDTRFWAKVDRRGETGCWEWTAAKDRHGYGVIGRGTREEGVARAHRVSYELNVGPIPEGLVIDHLCRNRGCVNPAHLEVVSLGENTARGESHARLRDVMDARTHCKHGHEFTEQNTRRDARTGGKRCRECARIEGRERMRRNRIPKTGEVFGDDTD